MKVSVFSIPEISIGKHDIKDPRLDQVHAITKSQKKTYIQIECAGIDAAVDADALLTLKESCTDLILKDLEFVETRLQRADIDAEKALLAKLKDILEKEKFSCGMELSEEEKKLMSGYGMLTWRPIIAAEKNELEDLNGLLARCVREAGFISFFTSGEKETRAWLIKKGTTAWEAAGSVHSDIQKGFIRAEVVSFNDFISCAGEGAAKQAGKLRLEQKDYQMQDADWVNFRFNK